MMAMSPPMQWLQLLSDRRLGKWEASAHPSDREGLRTEFFKDWDRLVFSTAFRRLQDKTQVVPLADNDYVRTRLTHSLEVASVGRSLGALAGHHLLEHSPGLQSRLTAHDVGSIVAAACLMHDIGNPPFGHEGEATIQAWFAGPGAPLLAPLSPEQQLDFLHFEGNAQGLRTVVRLQYPDRLGGLQLTCATLGAFTKYPRSATASPAQRRKFGFMASEAEWFTQLARQLGLQEQSPGQAWCRHPLAFLVEAADDICYCVVDVEDAVKMRLLAYEELEALHEPFLDDEHRRRAAGIRDLQHRAEYLRAITIGVLVHQAFEVFRTHHLALLDGRWTTPLCEVLPLTAELQAFRHLAQRKVYAAKARSEAQMAHHVLPPLLDRLGTAVMKARQGVGLNASDQEAMQALNLSAQELRQRSPYEQAQTITDFVAGMTDRFAVSLHQRWHFTQS